MKDRFQIPSLILYALITITIVISIFCFVKALSWVNKPFPGFLIYKDAFVGSFGSRNWPGPAAGLKFLDRIVGVDGQLVSDGQEVIDIARKKKPNTSVHYLVKSRGEIREVTVPVSIFGIKDFFLVFFVTFLGGFVFYALGVVVYILKPNIPTSWVFLLAGSFLGTYMGSGFEIQSTYSLVRFHYFILAIFPAFWFHLGLIFPERKQVLNRFPALEYLIYFPALTLALVFQVYLFVFKEVLTSDSFSWMPSYRELGSIARIFTLFCFLSLITSVFHSYYKAYTIKARQRARLILFGVTIAAAPSAILMTLVFFIKVKFPWNFLVFFLVFFPAAIAYSIVKHNLFDADEIIKRTVGYVVVTAIVVGAYIGVSLTLNVFMGKYQVAQSRAFPILFTLGVILVFNPLRNRIQGIVDRVFFRKEYDYGTILENVGGAMTSLLELPKILKRLTQTFIQDMFINTSSVMLLSHDGTQYQVYLADGERKEDIEKVALKRNVPLVEIIEEEKKELTKYDVIEDPKYKMVSDSCSADFEALNASLMIPLVYQNEVIGSLNLGEKKSGKSYNRQDIELLRTLASQGAVAIENARLFQENLEKQRMEEELNIARDLQMSMLPATCPEIKGFKIAATSTPAREVGGDFYDFIEMGSDRVGLIVGDVTGKSVSGALVMSASRSVFRMLSEEQFTVGDIMLRANRRIKKDVTGGMFVALLYAVLDAKDSTLSLCSAGQTQPIYLSASTGKAKLVETEGDNFPLGILEEADYQQTQLQLEHGDKIVFYTDGIVEAMNEEEEIFGFERLLEVIKGARSESADSLLKEILDSVSAFAGGAPQHDDLTVIVARAED